MQQNPFTRILIIMLRPYKPRRTASAALAVFLLAATALAADTPVELKRGGKVGDSQISKVTISLDVEGSAMILESKIKETLKSLDKDGGYSTEIQFVGGSMSFDGETEEIEADDSKEVSQFGKRGELKSVDKSEEEMDTDSNRLSTIVGVYYPEKPVKVGDKWSYEGKSSDKLGTRDHKASFEILAREKVGTADCLKVKVSSTESEGEDPSSVEATMYIDIATGTVVKGEGTIKNMPFGDEPFPGDAKFVVERVAE